METRSVQGLGLFYDVEESEAAELIGQACAQTVQLIHEYWGLETPEDLRVYVMTSWLHFLFHSPPWPWRILVGAALPFLYFRIHRMWPYVGGWEQRYGQRRAVGVKPPWLMASSSCLFVAETMRTSTLTGLGLPICSICCCSMARRILD